MKKLFLCFLLLSGHTLGAQDLISHVPSDVTFLFSWNASQVSQKVNTRQLLQQESVDLLFQDMVKGLDSLQQEEYYNLLTNPETYGINSKQSIHLLGRNNGEGSFYALMFPLFNASLFEEFVARQAIITDQPGEIMEMEGYKLVQMGGYYLGWNETIGVIAYGEAAAPQYDFTFPEENPYDYEEYPTYDEEVPTEEIAVEEAPVIEEVVEEVAPVEEEMIIEAPVEEEDIVIEAPYPMDYPEEEPYTETEAVTGWVDELLNRYFDQSLTSNPDYLAAAAKPADAHLWVDYRQFMSMGQGGMGGFGAQGMAALGGANQLIDQMYKDVFLTMTLNFNQGALELQSQMVGSGKMIEVMKNAYDAKFNKKMWKYVDGRELLGYYSVRFDVEDLVEGFKEIFLSAMADMPMFGNSFSKVTDVLGIIIDEDALYDLFKGDIMVAMTGVRQSETPVTSYEYDENFNPSQVEKIVKKQFPEFLVMTSYGNEENMMKLIRLAESFNVAISMGSYYQIPGGTDGQEYFLALKDGVLLFTNDGALIQEDLDSGVAASSRLGKMHRKNLRKNVQSMFWDVQATWNALQQTDAAATGGEMAEAMEKVQDKLDSISMLTSRKSLRTSLTLDLMDKESNALEQVLYLINQVVLEAAGLKRI